MNRNFLSGLSLVALLGAGCSKEKALILDEAKPSSKYQGSLSQIDQNCTTNWLNTGLVFEDARFSTVKTWLNAGPVVEDAEFFAVETTNDRAATTTFYVYLDAAGIPMDPENELFELKNNGINWQIRFKNDYFDIFSIRVVQFSCDLDDLPSFIINNKQYSDTNYEWLKTQELNGHPIIVSDIKVL